MGIEEATVSEAAQGRDRSEGVEPRQVSKHGVSDLADLATVHERELLLLGEAVPQSFEPHALLVGEQVREHQRRDEAVALAARIEQWTREARGLHLLAHQADAAADVLGDAELSEHPRDS